MTTALLIFPHQLFSDHPGFHGDCDRVVIIEEPLFFGDPQYPAKFHKGKLAYHRATISAYVDRLERAGHNVERVDYEHDTGLLKTTLKRLADDGVTRVTYAHPHDCTLEKRLAKAIDAAGLDHEEYDTPAFINTPQLNREYRDGKKRWFMADFYKFQRTRLDILMDGDEPEGGQWSFDDDNRKKVPKSKLNEVPQIHPRNATPYEQDAREWVEEHFCDNYGSAESLWFPIDHDGAADWLETFLEKRFHNFGPYEDAIVKGESWLWHGVLTPMLNTGLLTPRQIVNNTLAFAEKHDVPINSLEGFIRQIIGWREFMAATYADLGVEMRTTNHWKHERKIPRSFYDGTTGIGPIDDAITRINETAYAHHIERLMVLGGFMFLCEFDPDDVYRWFMEMFVDSYDWVMVPNAYAMSQHADGGLITTKPYFSGSNYIKKMSNYPAGEWADIWDGLYWRFIWKHHDRLAKNPRWAMMCRTAAKMDPVKRDAHIARADGYLAALDG
ncbi:MAG: cryptochrome/photolyase family protein [Pseudomonadota bacterium]